MAATVLGLDLSSTRTGVAYPTGRTGALVPPKGDRGGRLHWQLGTLTRVLHLYRPDVVVAEGILQSFALAGQALAMAHATLEVAAYEAGVPVVRVHPSRLKRYATGRGNADKAAMIAAARAAGAEVAGDDEADAWLLRALGVHAMTGTDLLDGDDPGHRLEIVAEHTWPVVR